MALIATFSSVSLFSLFFACFHSVTLSAVITSPPQDVTILLYNIAVFNCTGVGDQLLWTHDGNSIDKRAKQQYQISIVDHNASDGMVSSSLYINATIENDGVIIGCNVLAHDLVSAGADLTVRRISPVENLSLSIDDIPYATWTMPSVIATDIPVSNIRYMMTLKGGNITSTANDIDDTYYQFTDITVLNCTIYTATVTAYDVNNQVYSSDTAMAEDSIADTSKN